MAGELQVTGQAELRRSLAGLKRDLRDLSPVNREIAGDLARAIGSRAPRRTGALAASWRPVAKPEAATATSALAYAGIQNWGNPGHNITGTHYAEEALAAAESGAQRKYDAGVSRLCRKAES